MSDPIRRETDKADTPSPGRSRAYVGVNFVNFAAVPRARVRSTATFGTFRRAYRLRSRFSMKPRAENQSLAALVHRKTQMTTRKTRPTTTVAFIGET